MSIVDESLTPTAHLHAHGTEFIYRWRRHLPITVIYVAQVRLKSFATEEPGPPIFPVLFLLCRRAVPVTLLSRR